MMNLICLMAYSIADIQDYFEFIIKKHGTLTENPPVQIYPNKIKNRNVFKVKTGYKLGLVGSTKKDVDQDKDGEDVPKLESVEIVLVHCSLVNNNFQQASKVLSTFVPNKQFRQVINIAPHLLIMLNTTNTNISSTEVRFTDQNNEHLEIEDNVNMTLIIG